MATQTIKMVFQFRRDTAENWLANKNVVPAAGEPCFIIDKNVLKIGDGMTTFENLPGIGGVNVEIAADGSSVVLENDVFKLMGFDAAEVGAQPRKNADGKLEWVVPSSETVEGLQATVAGLQSDVAALQEAIGAVEGEDPLATRIGTLEEKMDGTGEGSVDAKIDAKINAWANDVTDDGEVNTVVEFINYVKTHGGEASAMASDIDALQELVGTDPVADQISAAIGNITTGEKNKIEAIKLNGELLEINDNKEVVIPVGAGLKESEEIIIAEDGTLSIGYVGFDKLFGEDDEIALDGGSASGK